MTPILLTPGPVTTSEHVRRAMLQDSGTWDDDYLSLTQNVRSQILQLATKDVADFAVVLLQGSGTYAVEAALSSMVPRTGTLGILINGAYGERMLDIAQRCNIPTEVLRIAESSPLSRVHIVKLLANNPNLTHVALVHCETTTGIINPIIELAGEMRNRGITLIVDAISSFGGYALDMNQLGIDILIGTANKCLQGVPGIAFVVARRRCLEKAEGHPVSLSLDLAAQWREMEQHPGKWRFTSPTQVLQALAAALAELEMEGGVGERARRYQANHDALVARMRSLGYATLLRDSCQSRIVTTFLYPHPQFDFGVFYKRLKARGFLIYPGKTTLADTFRIGHIGAVDVAVMDRVADAVGEIGMAHALLPT